MPDWNVLYTSECVLRVLSSVIFHLKYKLRVPTSMLSFPRSKSHLKRFFIKTSIKKKLLSSQEPFVCLATWPALPLVPGTWPLTPDPWLSPLSPLSPSWEAKRKLWVQGGRQTAVRQQMGHQLAATGGFIWGDASSIPLPALKSKQKFILLRQSFNPGKFHNWPNYVRRYSKESYFLFTRSLPF